MTQLALEQQKNLVRVSGRIGGVVLAFCRDHVGREFFMRELTAYVWDNWPAAPDSAGRILRLLKEDGLIDYEVVNRAKSLYRVTAVYA